MTCLQAIPCLSLLCNHQRGPDVLFRANYMAKQSNTLTPVAVQNIGPFQILNEETGEILDKYLYIEGAPRTYRFDAKEGVFAIEGVDKVGRTITFQPIAWRIFTDDVLKQGLKQWAEIFFIDEHDCVSTVAFHGYSVDNVLNLIKPLTYARKKLSDVVVTAVAEKKENNKIQPKGTYYIASFTYVLAKPDQVKGFKEYIDTVKLYRRETITAAASYKTIVNVFNPFAPENCGYLAEAGFVKPEQSEDLEVAVGEEAEIETA